MSERSEGYRSLRAAPCKLIDKTFSLAQRGMKEFVVAAIARPYWRQITWNVGIGIPLVAIFNVFGSPRRSPLRAQRPRRPGIYDIARATPHLNDRKNAYHNPHNTQKKHKGTPSRSTVCNLEKWEQCIPRGRLFPTTLLHRTGRDKAKDRAKTRLWGQKTLHETAQGGHCRRCSRVVF